MRVFLINLARRPDRLRKMTAQLRSMKLPFQRIDAMDARTTSDAEIARRFAESGPLGALPKGDKCCSLSHLRAWRAFLDSGESHGLVLEDDIVLDPRAAPLLADIGWIPQSVELLKIEHFGPPGQRVLMDEPVTVAGTRTIGRLRSRHTGAGAYILTRRAAQLLIGHAERWPLPVDHMLFNPNNSPLFAALAPRQIFPAIARQQAFVGSKSDIESWRAAPRGLMAHARRELVRLGYELKLLPRQLAGVLSGRTKFVRVGGNF